MDSDKHLTFVFIFMLMVIAVIIGEANNQALNQRDRMKKEPRLTQVQKQAINPAVSQPSEVR